MGYACPVCETPQRDGEHLANHLAFTAMLGDQAHEDWLAEYAPGWDEAGPTELAERVVEHAEETEYREVFEDTVDRHDHAGTDPADQLVDHSSHDHESGSGPVGPGVDPEAARQRSDGALDAEAEHILQEAQEMTRELLDSEESADRPDEGKDS